MAIIENNDIMAIVKKYTNLTWQKVKVKKSL